MYRAVCGVMHFYLLASLLCCDEQRNHTRLEPQLHRPFHICIKIKTKIGSTHIYSLAMRGNCKSLAASATCAPGKPSSPHLHSSAAETES